MEFSLKSLWATLSSGEVRFRRVTPCILNLDINALDSSCIDASIEVSGDIVDLASKDSLWMFTACTCACCGVRERELHCQAGNEDNAKESFHMKYPMLKSVEAGSDVRHIGRIEIAFQDGDVLSVGFECTSKEHARQFRQLSASLAKSGNFVSCQSSGCNTMRRMPAKCEPVPRETDGRSLDEADRHMQELLEMARMEEVAHARSIDRKRMKKKLGRADRSKIVDIVAQTKRDTSDARAKHDHLIARSSQRDSHEDASSMPRKDEHAHEADSGSLEEVDHQKQPDEPHGVWSRGSTWMMTEGADAGDEGARAASLVVRPFRLGNSQEDDSSVPAKDEHGQGEADGGPFEAADRHMQELLEMSRMEDVAHARSVNRKKMKKKLGKAGHGKIVDREAKLQQETLAVQEKDDCHVAHGAQNNIHDHDSRTLTKNERAHAAADGGSSEGADRHMHEFMESTRMQEVAHTFSADHKRMKKKLGKADSIEMGDFTTEIQLETPAAQEKKNSSEHNGHEDASKSSVQATFSDGLPLATAYLTRERNASDSTISTTCSLEDELSALRAQLAEVQRQREAETSALRQQLAEALSQKSIAEVGCEESPEDASARALKEILGIRAQAVRASSSDQIVRGAKPRQPGDMPAVHLEEDALEEEERRIANDGNSYSKAEFQGYYKESWQSKWNAAQAALCSTPVPDDTILTAEDCWATVGSWATVGRRKDTLRLEKANLSLDAVEVQTFADHTHKAPMDGVDAPETKSRTRNVEVQTMTPAMELKAWTDPSHPSKEFLHQRAKTADMQTQTETLSIQTDFVRPEEKHVGEYELDESTPDLLPMTIDPCVHRARCIAARSDEAAKVELPKPCSMIQCTSDLVACSDGDSDVSTSCCREGCCDHSRCDTALLTDFGLCSYEMASWSLAHELGENVLDEAEMASWSVAHELRENILDEAEMASWSVAHKLGEHVLDEAEMASWSVAHTLGEKVLDDAYTMQTLAGL